MYLVLCGGPWFNWTWPLYKVLNTDQFALFYMLTARKTKTIYWRCSLFFSIVSFLLLCQRSSFLRFVGVFMGLQLYSIDQSVTQSILCRFCHYCSVVQLEVRDVNYSRSSFFYCWELVLLFRFLNSIWNWELFFPSLWRIELAF